MYCKTIKKKIIFEYLRRNKSVTNLSQTYNISRSTIYNWINNYKTQSNPKLNLSNLSNLINLGYRPKDLSYMYNVSLNTIYYNLNKHKKINIVNQPLVKTIQIQNAIIETIFNDFLKNDGSNSLKTKIIESLRYKYKITTLCKVINIKYSTYYYQHNKKPTYYEIRDMKLTKMIKELFYNHHHRIGTTKIKALLKKKEKL